MNPDTLGFLGPGFHIQIPTLVASGNCTHVQEARHVGSFLHQDPFQGPQHSMALL